jgi:hypothetical protein
MFESTSTVTSTGTRTITIPELANGLVVNQVYCVSGNKDYPVDLVSSADVQHLENSGSTSSIPQYVVQRGNTLEAYPAPPAGTSFKIRFQLRPPKLVISQGRITSVGASSLVLDAIGSDLTTALTDLKCFINVVDSTTGLLKGTYQINSITTTTSTIAVKTSSLNRSSVFNQTVSSSLDSTVAVDDYVCLAHGTCVPRLVGDYSDFLVAYAVRELKLKNGISITEDLTLLNELEEDIKSMWAGRPQTRRVQRRNPYWGTRASLLDRYR